MRSASSSMPGAQGFQHDAATCAAIVRVLCGSGAEKKLIPLFSEIISSDEDSGGFDVLGMFGSLSEGQNCGNVVIDAFDAVIRAYAGLKMSDRPAQTFFQLCVRGYVPSIKTCNFLMNFLVGCGDVKSVEDVYSQIKRSQVRTNWYTFRILTEALCRQGKIDEALELLLEMKQKEGIEPDSSIFQELVRGMCTHGRPVYGYILLKYVRRSGISMATFTYNLVISKFCEMKQLREAEEVLKDMVEQGVPPDVYTYGSFIGGYCSSRNIWRALSLCDQMALRGMKTNRCIESSILKWLSELGMNAEVLKLFKLYKNLGHVDKVLYNIAIDAQCKLGRMEEAVETFQEMRGCGLVPDKIHYTTLINGYCRQGKLDHAWKTFNCMTNVGVKPDAVTYKILASGFDKSAHLALLN